MNTLLGNRIKILREAKNYTQEQVADCLGISRQRYTRIEKGTSSISFDLLTKIAAMLDVTVSDITRILEKEPAVTCSTGTEKILNMLDLFYANKEIYSRLQHRHSM